jgi:hypothetical protein
VIFIIHRHQLPLYDRILLTKITWMLIICIEIEVTVQIVLYVYISFFPGINNARSYTLKTIIVHSDLHKLLMNYLLSFRFKRRSQSKTIEWNSATAKPKRPSLSIGTWQLFTSKMPKHHLSLNPFSWKIQDLVVVSCMVSSDYTSLGIIYFNQEIYHYITGFIVFINM